MLRRSKDAQPGSAAASQKVELLAAEATRAYEAWDRAKLEDGVDRVSGVQLKKDEVVYLILDGVGLVEPRRGPTQWVGGSQGVSFKIAKGVRYRVGHTRGHVVQGAERPVVIDNGTGVVTNQRMVFVGSMRSTEWAYSKLLGFSLEQDGMALFNVSNRQKVSGFAYQPEVDHIVDAVVSAAIAAFQSPEDHAAVLGGFLDAYTDTYAQWESAKSGGYPPPRLQ